MGYTVKPSSLLSESEFRRESNYLTLCKALDIEPEDLDYLSPLEIEAVIKGILEEEKNKPSEYELAMDVAIITLEGREFEVKRPSIAQGRKIISKVGAILTKYQKQIQTLIKSQEIEDETEILIYLLQDAEALGNGIVDDYLDFVFTFVPELRENEEWIENNVSFDEFIGETIKVFPFFLQIIKKIGGTLNKILPNLRQS